MFEFKKANDGIGVISLNKRARITGEMSANFRKWQETVDLKSCSTVIVDGSNIEFIDSMGIAALISIYKTISAKGSDLILVNLSEEIKKLLNTLRLDRLFIVKDCSVVEAIKDLC
ncbi:MAG: STAS domain-containing protein [Kosmotogaceae bacterium]|nr:STAS domain-containing protein [Kosmotogaceae bacterium]